MQTALTGYKYKNYTLAAIAIQVHHDCGYMPCQNMVQPYETCSLMDQQNVYQ